MGWKIMIICRNYSWELPQSLAWFTYPEETANFKSFLSTVKRQVQRINLEKIFRQILSRTFWDVPIYVRTCIFQIKQLFKGQAQV